MKKFKLLIVLVASLLFTQGCKKGLLDVTYDNNPAFEKVYSSGADVENVAAGLFNILYNGEQSSGAVGPMLATAADNVSCSFGNFAMRDNSFEPRDNAWNNSASYTYNAQTNNLFNTSYAAINTADNVIKALAAGTQIGVGGADNNRAKAVAKFSQGVGYADLALVFDKAFDLANVGSGTYTDAKPYTVMSAAAIRCFDEAIAIASANTFTIPAAWLGTTGPVSSADFNKLVNTYAARTLSYMPRNKTELLAANWAKIKTYADAGITADFSVVNDGYTAWYDEANDYLTYSGWGVTDMYVVNKMDPTKPAHWDDSPTFPYPTPSVNPLDKRMNSDFEYLPSNWFSAARGYYHYSSVRHKRYDNFYIAAVGPKPQVMKAENDMLKAEARIYGTTPDLVGAAAIINASTRVTRGLMPIVAPVAADLVAAISHERHVEMYAVAYGIPFFDMRKLNLLQKGTPLHYPLPAKLLEKLAVPLPFYTYGTVAKADGINTSNSGWR